MKKLLITTAVALALAVGAVLAAYFGIKSEYYEVNIYEKACDYFILPLWAFSVAPAYVYLIEWLSEKSFEQSFRFGYVIGFFLPLLIAPVLMVFFYVSTVENLIKKR